MPKTNYYLSPARKMHHKQENARKKINYNASQAREYKKKQMTLHHKQKTEKNIGTPTLLTQDVAIQNLAHPLESWVMCLLLVEMLRHSQLPQQLHS